MLKNFKLLPISLASIVAVNSAYANSGFFVGGSANIQQNAYSKTDSNSGSNANKISNLAETTKQIKNKITNTENNIKNRMLANASLEQAIMIKDIEREILTKFADLDPDLNGNRFQYELSKFTLINTPIEGEMTISIRTEAKNGDLTITKIGKVEFEYNGEKFAPEQRVEVKVLSNEKREDVKSKLRRKELDLAYQNSSNKLEYRDSLMDGRKDLRELRVTEFKLKAQLDKLKVSELASIKSSASKISPSISLLAGYGVKHNNFGFITEAGIDLNFGKVGDNSKQELEVKNLYNVYLTQKVGYYFNENNLTYITGGLSIKDTKVSYKGALVSIDEKKITPNLILGVGYQRTLTRNWAMFTEFNHIVSLSKVKTEAGEVKTRSEQVRIGARYYF